MPEIFGKNKIIRLKLHKMGIYEIKLIYVGFAQIRYHVDISIFFLSRVLVNYFSLEDEEGAMKGKVFKGKNIEEFRNKKYSS